MDNKLLWIKRVEEISYEGDKQISIKQYYDQARSERPYFFLGFDYLMPDPFHLFDEEAKLVNIYDSEVHWSPIDIKKYLPKEFAGLHVLGVADIYLTFRRSLIKKIHFFYMLAEATNDDFLVLHQFALNKLWLI